MNAVQRVLNRRYLYGGAVWTLGAIYKDLQLAAAAKLPDDPQGQRDLVEAYMHGFIARNPEPLPDDVPTVVIDGMTFLGGQTDE